MQAQFNPFASLVGQVTNSPPKHFAIHVPIAAKRKDMLDAAAVVVAQQIKEHGPRYIKHLTGPTGLSRTDVTYLLRNRSSVFRKQKCGAYELIDSESNYVSRNAAFKQRGEDVYAVFAKANGPITVDAVLAELNIKKSQVRWSVYKLVADKRLVLVELSPQGNKPSTYAVAA